MHITLVSLPAYYNYLSFFIIIIGVGRKEGDPHIPVLASQLASLFFPLCWRPLEAEVVGQGKPLKPLVNSKVRGWDYHHDSL